MLDNIKKIIALLDSARARSLDAATSTILLDAANFARESGFVSLGSQLDEGAKLVFQSFLDGNPRFADNILLGLQGMANSKLITLIGVGSGGTIPFTPTGITPVVPVVLPPPIDLSRIVNGQLPQPPMSDFTDMNDAEIEDAIAFSHLGGSGAIEQALFGAIGGLFGLTGPTAPVAPPGVTTTVGGTGFLPALGTTVPTGSGAAIDPTLLDRILAILGAAAGGTPIGAAGQEIASQIAAAVPVTVQGVVQGNALTMPAITAPTLSSRLKAPRGYRIVTVQRDHPGFQDAINFGGVLQPDGSVKIAMLPRVARKFRLLPPQRQKGISGSQIRQLKKAARLKHKIFHLAVDADVTVTKAQIKHDQTHHNGHRY